MQDEKTASMNASDSELNEKFGHEPKENKLVRLIKSVVISAEQGTYVDESIVKFKYYNAFNYSLLSRDRENIHLSMGVTGTRRGIGKTLVACNLAVSLALGSQKKTVLVDLHVANPRLHTIFGVSPTPGLADAFLNGQIHVTRTAIDNLAILPIGNFVPTLEETRPLGDSSTVVVEPITVRPELGIHHLSAFRDVVYSLEQEFDVVIVDMPPINNESVSVLFANQLNGVIVVIDSGRTKREELDSMFHQLNERQVLGFVLNRFNERLSV
ncbi:MAG TPA: CpsD/CapB family tyrosine-protein kinase [Bacteroidota bacterium]|nr:CpsD/CapB family tyrosine-protein kinase [Bacteroidota bacterium]